jgi:hypothetical protein
VIVTGTGRFSLNLLTTDYAAGWSRIAVFVERLAGPDSTSTLLLHIES